jgi:diguanylate cyclase (GGDEF)-like protein/PAS domain S-box-containing protein
MALNQPPATVEQQGDRPGDTPGEPPMQTRHADGVFAEHIRHLYRLARIGYFGTVLNATLMMFVLWDVSARVPLIAWYASTIGVSIARHLLGRAFLRANPGAGDMAVWANYATIGAIAIGSMWGVLGSLLFPVDTISYQFLVIFLIGGMSVTALGILGSYRPAYVGFVLPAILPLTITIFAQGTQLHIFMGGLCLVFLGVVFGAAPLVSDTIRDSLRVKFENVDLVQRLPRAHADISAAHDRLNQQFEEQRVTAEQLLRARRSLEALIDAAPIAIVLRDQQGTIIQWSKAAERMFGWTAAEALAAEPNMVPADCREESNAFRMTILSGAVFADVETVRLRKDGTLIPVSISGALVRDVDGNRQGHVTLITDISERRRTETRQRLQNDVTLMLAEAYSIGQAMPRVLQKISETLDFAYASRWELDTSTRVLVCAESWSEPGSPMDEFSATSTMQAHSSEDTNSLMRKVWMTGLPIWIDDLTRVQSFIRREAALAAGLRSVCAVPVLVGTEFYGVMEFYSRRNAPVDQMVLQLLQTISIQVGQFIARKLAEQNLQFVATHDALTGLYNRSMFIQRLHQALAAAQRRDRRLAVFFIDLDGFKIINDTQGHDAGDVMLVQIAARVRDALRESDTTGRLGGDEFVVLIEEYENVGQITEVARKLLDRIAQPVMVQDRLHHVTASIGIATYPDDARDAQGLLNYADIAMYRAKEQGKNNFQFFSSAMNTHLTERLSLESGLRMSIERDELTLLYQPIVATSDVRIVGVEALVRWRHPRQGLLPPEDFVPVADESGFFPSLGSWVLRSACEQVRMWRDAGQHVTMAVNISPRQFGHEQFLQTLREAMHDTGVPANALQLEVTEQTLMLYADQADRILGQLKAMGFSVVIDDFGTGQSSLNLLNRLPVDGIKIDRSLISEIPASRERSALVRAMVAMAGSLSLRVTAEGVETQEQREFLLSIGCQSMQGAVVSMPCDAEVVTRLLRDGMTLARGNVQPLWPGPGRPAG